MDGVREGWGHADEAYGDQRWSEMVGGMRTRADKAYHDITPLLCWYISEQCSASLTSRAVGCSQGGSSRGVWGIRVLEVEFLYSGWGVDFSVGEPHVIRVQPTNKLNKVP